MAEGLVNQFSSEYVAFSAGTEKTEVNPFAILVLQEIGVDISKLRSKIITEYSKAKFDYVVTVCDSAKETCPFFPARKEIIHAPFPDPSLFGHTDEDRIWIYRKTRNEISTWLKSRFNIISDLETQSS